MKTYRTDSADYSQMTDDEFDGILESFADAMGVGRILEIPGVYDLVREELNNGVLESWEHANPDKAFPDSDECTCDD